MYTTWIGIGAMAGVIGWYIVKSRVRAAEAERSIADAKSRKRFSRGTEADAAAEVLPRKRDFGRR